MKRILIVGANSYIGTSFEKYVSKYDSDYEIVTLNTIGLSPEKHMFEKFDVVFYVAGIAHRKETKKNKPLYYKVNRDLAIETAKKAKEAGVSQFIILSSMNVYGLTVGHITKETVPHPINAYGKSKLQADKKIMTMGDEGFRVAILRPPMVYGKDCKGNYQKLRTFILKSPFFPEYKNERSMIYIGNLCEFIKMVIDNCLTGIFFPQNEKYIVTSQLAKLIAKANGKEVKSITACNGIIKLASISLVKKVFGSLTYEHVDTVGKYGFEESVFLTEKGMQNTNKKSINLWIFHHYATTPNRNGYIRPFRFASHLKKNGVNTSIFASSYHHWSGENVICGREMYKLEYADGIPFIFVRTPSSASGVIARIKNMTAFAVRLPWVGKRVENRIGRPDMILASSPHPFTMIAGIRFAKKNGIPCICEIRDLWPEAIFAGGKIKENSILGKILIIAEYWIYKNADALIFTKEGDIDYLFERKWMSSQGGKIKPEKCFYINNGVELDLYDQQKVNIKLDDQDLLDKTFKIIYAGAIRPINDVENIVNAAKLLPENSNAKILIYGDGNLRNELEEKVKREHIDNVKFKGYVEQKYIPYILSKSSVNILNYSSKNYNWTRGNSSNKLFEYLASGKPIIATIKTGYSIIQKYKCGLEMEEESSEELAKDIMLIQSMDTEDYNSMCINARNAAKDFDYHKLSEQLLAVINWVKK